MAVSPHTLKAGLAKRPAPSAALASSTINELMGRNPATKEAVEIPLPLLDPHPEQHVFSMNEDELEYLAKSIVDVGVLEPVILRPQANGRYTILAGHRRAEGSKRAGKKTIPAFIENVDDATATAIFYVTNIGSRHTLRPSEKAKGYLRIEEALQAKGATTGRTTASISEISGDNKRQIQRYMRLNALTAALLQKVDTGLIPFRAGVELSYLSSLSQDALCTVMDTQAVDTLTIKQAEELRALGGDNKDVTKEEFALFLTPQKQPLKSKPKAQVYTFKQEVFQSYFAPGTNSKEVEETIIKALKKYYGIEK